MVALSGLEQKFQRALKQVRRSLESRRRLYYRHDTHPQSAWVFARTWTTGDASIMLVGPSRDAGDIYSMVREIYYSPEGQWNLRYRRFWRLDVDYDDLERHGGEMYATPEAFAKMEKALDDLNENAVKAWNKARRG